MAFNVECCHTSGHCHTYLTAEEESQAVNEIGLTSPGCPRDNHPKWGVGGVSLSMLSHNSIGL